jgi:hypothetical protein
MKVNQASMNGDQRVAVMDAWSKLRHYIEQRDFAGFDPYDALNSPILRALTLRTAWGRIAVCQALRRCPIDLRRILLVRAGQNPKALALMLEAYSKLVQLSPDSAARAHLVRLVQLLSATCSKTQSGHGWGYNFDWQSRAFFVPKYTPTIVCSSFAGHALLDAYEQTGNQDALALAAPVADFFLRDLNRIAEGDAFCFSYTPVDHYAVHNANLLGASFLVRLGSLTGNRSCVETGVHAAAYSTKHQHDDGSWYYSERSGSRWVDSFHTGFNLEAIRWLLKYSPAAGFQSAFDDGIKYYSEKFFLADGTPKYYDRRVYPVDIHSAAEAIGFFSSEGPRYRPLAARILTWTLRNMLNTDGSFCFRKGKLLTNRIAYMRWGQAWMFRALTAYVYSQAQDATHSSGPDTTEMVAARRS